MLEIMFYVHPVKCVLETNVVRMVAPVLLHKIISPAAPEEKHLIVQPNRRRIIFSVHRINVAKLESVSNAAQCLIPLVLVYVNSLGNSVTLFTVHNQIDAVGPLTGK
jgi:hypothetical protein